MASPYLYGYKILITIKHLLVNFILIYLLTNTQKLPIKLIKNTMEESNGKSGAQGVDREEIFSKVVRAGKRTYFFDVKATKGNDYYLTITESKKRFGEDGKFFYEKHKLFLYKEDFGKFIEGLDETVSHIKTNYPAVSSGVPERKESYSDVRFEDLGTK